MSRKTAIGISVSLWVLIAWLWAFWPSLSFLQIRDVLPESSAWDTWRSLVIGPLDSDFSNLNPSGLQYAVAYGNWIFGWALLGLGLWSVSRIWQSDSDKQKNSLAYLALSVFIVVVLVVGRPQEQSQDLGAAPKTSDEVSGSCLNDPLDGIYQSQIPQPYRWSDLFLSVQLRMVREAREGASKFLSHRGFSGASSQWADWAAEASNCFQPASDRLSTLLRLISKEGKSDSYKAKVSERLLELDDNLQGFIYTSRLLSECSTTSGQGNSCDSLVADLLLYASFVEQLAVER